MPLPGSSAVADRPVAAAPPIPHLRPRGVGGAQPVTTVELFFDLVYVFAVTQLSHMVVDDLTFARVASAAFLLLVVWWAWIYTTWMANWFDPSSPRVRGVLALAMLASLLMAAALPGALDEHGWQFAGAYVALQVGRNLAAALLLPRGHAVRDIYERLVLWSVASGVLWLAGAAVDGEQRLLLWIPALLLELAAPIAGYWRPGRGHAGTSDYDIEGGHFAERCQLFIIIALGESIVVTGATASAAGLSPTVLLCLALAFAQIAAMWWVYFGATAERASATMASCEDPGRYARDAYTYGHLPIVGGIIATAVGVDLLIAHPDHALHGVALAAVLGGPALYLAGESLFRWRMTGAHNRPGLAVSAALLALVPIGGQVSALILSAMVTALLALLVAWEPVRQTRSLSQYSRQL
ncbi:low temperature requirement protein A [Solirubrobacter phytolaccae]|uniref:Low temperature requirement protein A n=1 Tax=Solirubrobacter phytolaccae TaxID=1404360 RepID=A0A9X3SCV0_9ACTN|nr:low temperature requirement protein A [Solirubrobacter phytolaccae]MDA0182930.1 low temperature requirement protein A [Solirubrobacter phytolaccae]